MDAEKRKALTVAIAQVERQFGKGSIMRLGEDQRVHVDVIPTGSLALDLALGIGGIPRGRVVEVFGHEQSGKTTLAYHLIAEAQKLGGTAAFIDAEHAIDPRYVRNIGVDIQNLLISQPDSGEQALEIAETLVRSGAIDVIVVDSVAALVPKAELEGDIGDEHVGLQARLMSQALRKLTAVIHRSRTCLLFTNQVRQKIGVIYGNPETTPGGLALKFYASVRIQVRRIGMIKSGQDIIGSQVQATIVKNKLAPPFRSAEIDLIHGQGISKEASLLDLAVGSEVVEKTGTWFTYNGERLGQGRENVRLFLKEHPEIAQELEARVREQYQI